MSDAKEGRRRGRRAPATRDSEGRASDMGRRRDNERRKRRPTASGAHAGTGARKIRGASNAAVATSDARKVDGARGAGCRYASASGARCVRRRDDERRERRASDLGRCRDDERRKDPRRWRHTPRSKCERHKLRQRRGSDERSEGGSTAREGRADDTRARETRE